MALLTLLNAQLAFGHVALLDHTDFALETNERVGLIGRNGTGKSSMLKILAKMEKADDGELQMQRGVRVAYVAQEPSLDGDATVYDAVADGLKATRAAIDEYMTGEGDLEALQTIIEQNDGWNWEQRVSETLQRLRIDPQAKISTLSGGTKKRVALGQALVQQPDVLLLDEPTNHLDLDAIAWLEGLLNDFGGSVVLITHDRAFLDGVCTRIVELDRGKLASYPGNFEAYELRKEEELKDEALANARFDKVLAAEEVWIRKGVEARRTRATARIERLTVLRNERAARRDQIGRVKLDIDKGSASGKIVAELENVSKTFVAGDGSIKQIVCNFSATILRGDKIGLIGPNGAGKTTLLKLILGELQPDPNPPGMPAPRMRQGSTITVAYFDQMREQLDLDSTLEDFISPGSEWIEINGQRKHVKSYLGDFLFSPARAGSPVRSLSGGERNRLLLARLFARPANVLVLDEPTNDLDIDTLELLEDLLQNYNGTVFLVSHDRRFLDNVVTSSIAYEGSEAEPGVWREYEGGVEDWLIQSARRKAALALEAKKDAARDGAKGASAGVAKATGKQIVATNNAATEARGSWTNAQKSGQNGDSGATSSLVPPQNGVAAPAANQPSLKKQKLSYKEQRELDGLPAQVAALEAEQAAIRAQLADGSLYGTDAAKAMQLAARDGAIDDQLLACLERLDVLGA